MLLEVARAELDAKVAKGKGVYCPCCDQRVQIYTRHLRASMAYFLVYLVKRGVTDWFHINRDMPEHRLMCGGDYAKLAFWGLLEAKPDEPDGKKSSSGFWRLTEKGRQFVRGEITVPTYVKLLHNKVWEVSAKCFDITEALRSGGFDYAELMQDAA